MREDMAWLIWVSFWAFPIWSSRYKHGCLKEQISHWSQQWFMPLLHQTCTRKHPNTILGMSNWSMQFKEGSYDPFHIDTHWFSTLYQYLRELAIQNHKKCVFISCDNSAKIDFGEPGALVSSGVHGKRSIIPTTSMLGMLDHNVNQKGKFKTIFFSKFPWCTCQSWSKWVVLLVILYQLLHFIFSVSMKYKT